MKRTTEKPAKLIRGSRGKARSKSRSLYYGCKCVFQHLGRSKRNLNFYEESVFLIRASSVKAARRKALEMAKAQTTKNVVFCGLVAMFPVLEMPLGDQAEIFSSFRISRLRSDSYLRRFYFSKSCYSPGWPGWWEEFDAANKE